MAPYVFFSSWVSPAKTWWPKIENVVAKNWKLSINWAFGKIGRLRARSDFAIHPSDSYIDNVRKTGELSEHLPRCNVVKMHLCSAGAQKITRWEDDRTGTLRGLKYHPSLFCFYCFDTDPVKKYLQGTKDQTINYKIFYRELYILMLTGQIHASGEQIVFRQLVVIIVYYRKKTFCTVCIRLQLVNGLSKKGFLFCQSYRNNPKNRILLKLSRCLAPICFVRITHEKLLVITHYVYLSVSTRSWLAIPVVERGSSSRNSSQIILKVLRKVN